MNQSGYADLLNTSYVNADSLIIGTLTLPNLDPNSVALIDSDNNLTDIILTNNQILQGVTGNLPIATSSPTLTGLTVMGNISGPTYSRSADSIVSCTTTETSGNLCSFTSSPNVIQDSGIPSGTGPWLPLTGGTMSGNINMNSNNLLNVNDITTYSNDVYINSSSLSTSRASIAIGLPSSNAFAGYTNAIAIGASSRAGANGVVSLGANTGVSADIGSVCIGTSANSVGVGGVAIGNCTQPIANGVMIGNSSCTQWLPNNNNTCNLGSSTNSFANLNLGGSVVGPTYTRTADNIVSNSGSSISGDLCSFSGITGKVVTDSNIIAANVVTNSGTGTSGDLASFSSNTVIQDTGIIASNVVTNSGTGTSGDLASFSSNKVIQDSGILASNVVTNSGTGTSGDLASFSSSKVIQDSGIVAANVVTITSGGGSSGDLASFTGTNTLTDSGIVASNVVVNNGTAVSGNVASFTANKIIHDSGVVAANVCYQNSALVTSGDLVEFSGTGGRQVADSGILSSNIVTCSSGQTTNHLVSFSSGTKVVQDSGLLTSNVFLADGSVSMTGAISGANSITFATTSGVIGTTTNNNAATGSVGEYISGSATAVSLSNGTAKTVTSISLTAGDWDIWGSIQISCSGTMTVVAGSVGTTTNTLNSSSTGFCQMNLSGYTASGLQALSCGIIRVSIASTTTAYLVGQSNFSSGTTNANGYISARRVR